MKIIRTGYQFNFVQFSILSSMVIDIGIRTLTPSNMIFIQVIIWLSISYASKNRNISLLKNKYYVFTITVAFKYVQVWSIDFVFLYMLTSNHKHWSISQLVNHSLIHSFIYSYMHSSIYSFIHQFIHSFINLFIHSSIIY